ncbi:hypothetical protein Glove_122g24 [Diversispora epigaea]|uniref:Uncharacterized protein n=1 Tax=Diversispora epigaea TaxID=1348612 RepID=A0A397IZ49_9GLOM|nr:hypothetical protein Glove_122g24 [Diversispora epigaea]
MRKEKKVGILQQYNSKLPFGLEEPQIRHSINSLHVPSCTLNNWNNSDIARGPISTSINWQEFFNQWLIESSTIIKLKFQLKKLYPSDHKINEHQSEINNICYQEPQIRHSINSLHVPSCTLNNWNNSDIARGPISTSINWQEFFNQWLIESSTIIKLKFQLKKLYPSDHKINEHQSEINNICYQTFWNSFRESLDVNKCSLEGRTRILSIIGESFTYDEIKKNLEVSNDTISYARKYTRLYGVGRKAFKKPIVTYENFSKETQLFC